MLVYIYQDRTCEWVSKISPTSVKVPPPPEEKDSQPRIYTEEIAQLLPATLRDVAVDDEKRKLITKEPQMDENNNNNNNNNNSTASTTHGKRKKSKVSLKRYY